MEKPNTCPLELLLSKVSGQWTLYLLWTLHLEGELRFGELKRKVSGISTKVLTNRLRMLESEKFLHRNYEPTVPPKVSYSLTEKGHELSEVLRGLSDFATRWQKIEDRVNERL